MNERGGSLVSLGRLLRLHTHRSHPPRLSFDSPNGLATFATSNEAVKSLRERPKTISGLFARFAKVDLSGRLHKMRQGNQT